MRLRRALLVTTAVSTVLFGSAGMAYAQSFDWSGFYVGVGVAGGMGSSDGELTWFDPDSDIWSTEVLGTSTNPSGAVPLVGDDGRSIDFPGGGDFGFGAFGSVGFNAQMDNFLFGIEASIMSGPFTAEDTYVESGTVTITTSAITTLFETNTTDHLSTSTSYTPTIITNTSSVTHTTTIINEPSTTVSTYTDTFVTYQTSTTNGTTETVYFPTSSVNTVTTSTSASSTTVVLTTSIETNLTSTDTVVNTFSASGSWTETITGRAQIDWLATIKGRIGITADRTLFFATGGLAIAGVSQETTAVLTVDQTDDGTVETVWHGSNDETRFGFVVGGGIEQALDDHWIVSGEFEYFNLGTAEYDVNETSSNLAGDNHGHQTQVLDGGSVKFGVKYKF